MPHPQTGDSAVAVVPALQNGRPAVCLVVKKQAVGVLDMTLDGQPALALILSEDADGCKNAPWELGSMLAGKWEEARKLAK
jgi:hypothetical protein